MFLGVEGLQFKNLVYICSPLAGVVELVDTLDLGFNQIKVLKILKKRAWWNW